MVSVLCGGTDFEHMEDTGYGKYNWLKKYLELSNRIALQVLFNHAMKGF